jgi:hypothetical protein
MWLRQIGIFGEQRAGAGDHSPSVGLVRFHFIQPRLDGGFGRFAPMRHCVRQQSHDHIARLRHSFGNGIRLEVPHSAGHSSRGQA